MALSFWQRILNTAQIKNSYSEIPAGLKWRSNTIFILTTVGVGLFTDLFLYLLIVPVLPFMLEDRVGLPENQIQSATSGLLAAYAGASVVFSPIAGVLADRVSTRQAPFLLGLSALLAATILLFVSKTVPLLVVARILQGISSGLVWTVGMALCMETVGPENLGKTTGTIFSFISAGNFGAPFLGGLIYEKAGLEGVLGVAFAVLAIDFILRLLMIEKKVAKRYMESDPSNAEEQNENQDVETANPEEEPLLAREDENDEDDEDYSLPEEKSRWAQILPILPLLYNPALLTALWLGLVQAILFGSLDATITTVSRDLFGFNSLTAGIMFLPAGASDFIFGPIAGWAVDRYGTKPMAVGSFAFMVPIFVLMRLPYEGGLDQIILYGGLLALLGVGLAGMGAPSIVEMGAVTQKYHERNKGFFGENGPYAQLYGMNSMLYMAGLAIGPELAGELKESIGYGNMNAVLAVICAFTAVVSFVYIGGKPKMLRTRKS